MLAGAGILGGAASGGRAWADAPALIRGLSLEPVGEAARITLNLDRSVEYRTFFLASPTRFVVDIANAQWALNQAASGQGAGVGVVERYRFASRPDGAGRLALDLAAPAGLLREERGSNRAPQLRFDLAAMREFAPRPTEPLVVRNTISRRRVVVIDPGHGGHDPGAIGVTGVQEKDVVLDAGLKLRQALESTGRYRVAMTRSDDTFVPLEGRVRFARAQNADLFISLHADSSPNREATGATVYTLSAHGAARAQNLIAAQNWDLDLGDAPRSSLVSDILVDLTQRETTNRSAQFAETVIPRLRQVAPVLSSNHRNAGFFVLLAPDVPAVLIETGFLSNAADEHRLASPREREVIAGAMAQAVDAYFENVAISSRA